jgi:hypothetical protein
MWGIREEKRERKGERMYIFILIVYLGFNLAQLALTTDVSMKQGFSIPVSSVSP